MTRRRLTLALLSIGALVLVAVAARELPVLDWLTAFRDWMASGGVLGVFAFIAAYCVATLVFGPAGLLSISAGLVWGFIGLPIVVVAATVAATLALFVGRYLARERVRRYVARDRRLVALVGAVSERDWRIVALIRLSPILPFGVQNYLLAVTDIRPVPYALATAAAILPSSALYVYLGRLGHTVGQDASLGDTGAVRWVLLALGIVATLLTVREVSRRARRALAEAVEVGEVVEVAEASDSIGAMEQSSRATRLPDEHHEPASGK